MAADGTPRPRGSRHARRRTSPRGGRSGPAEEVAEHALPRAGRTGPRSGRGAGPLRRPAGERRRAAAGSRRRRRPPPGAARAAPTARRSGPRARRERRPGPGEPTMPTIEAYAAAVAAGSGTTSSMPTRRAVPPKGWTNDARARRASSPHSAPFSSCSMRNGGSAGPSRGGKAQCQATVSPSGRTREPADRRRRSAEPAARSAITSRRAPSVASAYVTSPGAPASRARTTAAPIGCARASARSQTPISSR